MANLSDISSKVSQAKATATKAVQNTVNQANKLLNSASGTMNNVFGSSLSSLAKTFPTISSIFGNAKGDSSILSLIGGDVIKGTLETNHKLQSLLSSASAAIASPVSFLSRTINDVIKSASTLASGTGLKLLSGIGSSALNYVSKAVGFAINTATDLSKAVNTITSSVSGLISGVTSGISGFLGGIGNAVSSVLNGIGGFVSSLIGGIASSLNFGGDTVNPLMSILNGAAGIILNLTADSIGNAGNVGSNSRYNYNYTGSNDTDSVYKALTGKKDSYKVTSLHVEIEDKKTTKSNSKPSSTKSTSTSKKNSKKTASTTKTTTKKGKKSTTTTTTTKKKTTPTSTSNTSSTSGIASTSTNSNTSKNKSKITTTTTTTVITKTETTANGKPAAISFVDSNAQPVYLQTLKYLSNDMKKLLASSSMTANTNTTQRKMESLAESVDEILNSNMITAAGSQEAVQEKIAAYTVSMKDKIINAKNAENKVSTALYREARDLCPNVTNNKVVKASYKDKYNVLMNIAAENGETDLIRQLASCRTPQEEDYFDDITIKALKDSLDTVISNGDAETYLAIQEMVGRENIEVNKLKLLALAANIVNTTEHKSSFKRMLQNFNMSIGDILSPDGYELKDDLYSSLYKLNTKDKKFFNGYDNIYMIIHLNPNSQFEIASKLLEQVTSNKMEEFYMEYVDKYACYGFTWRYKGERWIHHLAPDYCLVQHMNGKYSVTTKTKFDKKIYNCNAVVAICTSEGGKSLSLDALDLSTRKLTQSAFYLYNQKSA